MTHELTPTMAERPMGGLESDNGLRDAGRELGT